MDSAQPLKDKARMLEASGQHQAALDLYSRILESAPEPDPALIVRMGNLHLRLGRTEQAVADFTRGAGLLESAGLVNSAIALLQRVLRIRPDLDPVLLQLGQLSSRAGYPEDARTWFSRYQERMESAGQPDAGLARLRQHLQARPGDHQIRRLLIERLEALGRAAEAAEESRALAGFQPPSERKPDPTSAYSSGWTSHAAGPASGASPEESESSGDDGTDELQVLSSGWERADASLLEDQEPATELEILPTHIGDVDAAHLDAAPVTGLEPTLLEGMEPTSAPRSARASEPPTVDDESLSLLDNQMAAGWDPDAAVEGAGLDDDDSSHGTWDELPLLGMEPDQEEESGASGADLPLPTLSGGYDDPDPMQALQARIRANPADVAAHAQLIGVLRKGGEADLLAAALQGAHPIFAAVGRLSEAADLVGELADLRPDADDLLVLRVEYAIRSGDDSRAVAALLALGHRLAARSRHARAREVFARVLEIDPENPDARWALATLPARLSRE